jgi:hypothetical protein
VHKCCISITAYLHKCISAGDKVQRCRGGAEVVQVQRWCRGGAGAEVVHRWQNCRCGAGVEVVQRCSDGAEML